MSDDSGRELTVKVGPPSGALEPRKPLEDALARAGMDRELPDILYRAGAGGSYVDFFVAEYDNPHTRRAYKRILDRFLSWTAERGKELGTIMPRDVGEYRDRLPSKASTKKQTLAALRQFFDLMVERHFCLINPARSARNPREEIEDGGKTPEIPIKEVHQLLGSINRETIVGKRDAAIIAAWACTGARIGAVSKVRIANMIYHDNQWNLELDEKNSRHRLVPMRHDLQPLIVNYLAAVGLTGAPPYHHIFLSARGRTGQFKDYEPEVFAEDGTLVRRARGAMSPDDMRRMLKRRLTDAGFGRKTTRQLPGVNKDTGRNHVYTQYQSLYSPHSFRVMVVTDLLGQGESTRDVAYMVGHKSERTTSGYDRSKQRVKRNLVERIRVNLEDTDSKQDLDETR